MGWLLKEKRGPAWKHGWADQTMTSISPPPLPLLAVFAIVVLFLSLSFYIDYKSQMQRTLINFRLFLFLLPVLLIFAMQSISSYGGLVFPGRKVKNTTVKLAASVPWGMVVLVAVLLVMVSYQASCRSKWFPTLWRSKY